MIIRTKTQYSLFLAMRAIGCEYPAWVHHISYIARGVLLLWIGLTIIEEVGSIIINTL